MQLVIAEKPSVAMSIAAVLGADKRQDGYMEGNGYLVGWCVGHLAGLADASHYGDYKKWRYEDLPILPETWQTVIAPDKKEPFDTLKKLMEREDVTRACLRHGCWIVRRGDKQIKIKKGLPQSFKGYDSNGYSLFYAVTTV